jgi:aspartate aminotransferase
VPPAAPPAMTELRKAARAVRAAALIDLSRSEPLPIPFPDACAARVAGEFARARTYSPPGGLGLARDAVARRMSERTGLDVGNDQVTIVPGAMAGISIALRALTNPGDEVLVPVPYFHSYPKQVAMFGALPRFVDTRPQQGELTPEALERELSPRTRALILCNPGNPTGVLLDRDRLAAILAVLPPSVAVIADEVYAEYLYEASDDAPDAAAGDGGRGFTSMLNVVADEDAGREVVVLETASKTAAMPGWRVGSAISSPGLAPRLASAAATLSGPASVPTQIAYAAWLDDPPALDRMAPYRPRLRDVLEALGAGPVDRPTAAGIAVRPPDGSYYVWVTGAAGADAGSSVAGAENAGIGSAEAVLETAKATGVLVWPGVLFGDAQSVRISLSVPRGDLQDGVTKLTDSWREVREGDVPISRSRR